MGSMKKIMFIMLSTFIFTSTAQAGENAFESKSTTLAVVLGLDLVPGDALFYAGKSGQGLGNIGVAVGGLGLAIVGAARAAGAGAGCNVNCDDPASVTMVTVGLSMYGASFLWDLIGGIYGVSSHNQKVARKTSWIQSLQPMVAATQ